MAIDASCMLPTVTVRVLVLYSLPIVTRTLALSIPVLVGLMLCGNGGLVLLTARIVLGLARLMKLAVILRVCSRLENRLLRLSAVNRRNREMSVCNRVVRLLDRLVCRALLLTWSTRLLWCRLVVGRMSRCR